MFALDAEQESASNKVLQAHTTIWNYQQIPWMSGCRVAKPCALYVVAPTAPRTSRH